LAKFVDIEPKAYRPAVLQGRVSFSLFFLSRNNNYFFYTSVPTTSYKPFHSVHYCNQPPCLPRPASPLHSPALRHVRRHRCYIYSDDEDMDDCSLRYRVPGAGGPSSVRRVSWDANGTACFVEEHPGDGHVRVKREPDFLDELVGGERVSVNHSWSSINEWGRNRFPRAPVLKRPRRHGAPRRPPWHPSCGTYLPPPPVGPSSPQPPRPRIIPS
jgi:hypothetical protein